MHCRYLVVAAVLAVAASSVETARAAVLLPASIFFTVDGLKFDVPTRAVGDGSAIGDDRPLIFQNDQFRLVISGFLDPDPSIAYGLAVTDFGTPSAFAFVFSTPIVPVGTPNVVSAPSDLMNAAVLAYAWNWNDCFDPSAIRNAVRPR